MPSLAWIAKQREATITPPQLDEQSSSAVARDDLDTLRAQIERPMDELENAVRSLLADGLDDGVDEFIARLDSIKWHCVELQNLAGADNSMAGLAERRAALGREIHRLQRIILERKNYLRARPELRGPEVSRWFAVMDSRIEKKRTQYAEISAELKRQHLAAYPGSDTDCDPLVALPPGETVYLDPLRAVVIRRETHRARSGREKVRTLVYRYTEGRWRYGSSPHHMGVAVRSLLAQLGTPDDALPQDGEALAACIKEACAEYERQHAEWVQGEDDADE